MFNIDDPKDPHVQMAAQGDVGGLLDVITEADRDEDLKKMFRLLLRAVNVACQADPAKFSEMFFSRLMGFSAYLAFRSQFLTAKAFAAHDEAQRGTMASEYLPVKVEKELLPHLLELQEHAAEIALMQARTARVWKLTQKDEDSSPAEGRKSRNGVHRPGTNGKHGAAAPYQAPTANGRFAVNTPGDLFDEVTNGKDHHDGE